MAVTFGPEHVLVFDLDDTLYKEIDFARSGFMAVAQRIKPSAGAEVFGELWQRFSDGQPDVLSWASEAYAGGGVRLDDLLSTYRFHEPNLELLPGARDLIARLNAGGYRLGLLTDGRSRTQRNKLRALGLAETFSEIVISEEFGSAKPAERNYEHFRRQYPDAPLVYIADNPAKDFVCANRLGWHTVCLRDDGRNIHKQTLPVPAEHQPQAIVDDLAEIRVR